MVMHRFLENFKETMTVREMRDKLYSLGVEKPKYYSLAYYLVFHYPGCDWHYLVNAPQGDNQEEVIKAQKMLNDVQVSLAECQRTAEASKKKEEDAKQAEKASKEAKAEVEKAFAEVESQENAVKAKTDEITKRTTEGGVVQQNKAKAELAAHLAEDPLPLRKAKINSAAAVKKAEKAAKAAEDAVIAAGNARKSAEAAVEDCFKKVAEAEAYLQEVKNKPGSAAGAIWWIDRELHEARAFLPTSKGGYAKKQHLAKE